MRHSWRWLSRSSEDRVKVRRWPQSPLGLFFIKLLPAVSFVAYCHHRVLQILTVQSWRKKCMQQVSRKTPLCSICCFQLSRNLYGELFAKSWCNLHWTVQSHFCWAMLYASAVAYMLSSWVCLLVLLSVSLRVLLSEVRCSTEMAKRYDRSR